MAGIPQNFQSISPVIANYDFVDIAAGTGYINFYAGKTVDLTLLSNFTYYSNSIVTTGSAIFNTPSPDYGLSIDIDFDTVMNRPLDARGKGIVNLGILPEYNGGTGAIYADVLFRKWDGSTETEICSNTGTIITTAAHTYQAIDLNIPLTHFKIGETLRLTIRVYAQTQGLGGDWARGYLAHDPLNRTTGWDATGAVPSKLMFQCPVRLNL